MTEERRMAPTTLPRATVVRSRYGYKDASCRSSDRARLRKLNLNPACVVWRESILPVKRGATEQRLEAWAIAGQGRSACPVDNMRDIFY